MPVPRLFKRREVAEMLQVGVSTVDRYRAKGLLPYIKITTGDPKARSATIRFTEEGVEKFINDLIRSNKNE